MAAATDNQSNPDGADVCVKGSDASDIEFIGSVTAAATKNRSENNLEDKLCLELGSTREVPGVTRPLVSRGVRSDGADVCCKGSDASDIEAIPFTFLNYTTLKKPIKCVMHGGES